MTAPLLKSKINLNGCNCGDMLCAVHGCKIENLSRVMVNTMINQTGNLVNAQERQRVIGQLWRIYAPMAGQVMQHFHKVARFTPRPKAVQQS